MLTVVALEAEATELGQVSAVAAALAMLARRQQIAVVSDRRAGGSPYRFTRELRAALPELRLVTVGGRTADSAADHLERIGGLLRRDAIPLILAPPGCTATVAATVADRFAATAVLRMAEPGVAGVGTGARLRGRRRSSQTRTVRDPGGGAAAPRPRHLER